MPTSFITDTSLPAGWYRVTHSDCTGSGYDRGHMTPSADRTASVADNEATFLLTNVLPQAPANNQGLWAQLEAYARDLVGQGNEVYVISGGCGQPWHPGRREADHPVLGLEGDPDPTGSRQR